MKKVVAFLTILTLGLTSCGTQNQVPEQNTQKSVLQEQKLSQNGVVYTYTSEGTRYGLSDGTQTCKVNGVTPKRIFVSGASRNTRFYIYKNGSIVDTWDVPANTSGSYYTNNYGTIDVGIHLLNCGFWGSSQDYAVFTFLYNWITI